MVPTVVVTAITWPDNELMVHFPLFQQNNDITCGECGSPIIEVYIQTPTYEGGGGGGNIESVYAPHHCSNPRCENHRFPPQSYRWWVAKP